MSAIVVRELTVRKNQHSLAGPVSFSLPLEGTLGLCGPSGVGKSTVLRTLVGLLPSDLRVTGTVRVLGTDVCTQRPAQLFELRTRVVLVPQTPVVFPDSILGNVLFGIRHVLRLPRGQLHQRAEAALVEVGLWSEVADRLHSPAVELSVGQRQRLALARALALDPEMLLLDEPTSSLDAVSAAGVEHALQILHSRRTLLVVSHDMKLLERLCGETVQLRGSQDQQEEEHDPRGLGNGPIPSGTSTVGVASRPTNK